MTSEHGHGPDCTCGCHDHDRDREHGHHHGHTENAELAWARVELEAHTHEQAATVSMGIHPKEGSPVVFSNLVDAMREIAQAAERAGGIVGHIKAFAKWDGSFARASVTAADLPPTCEGDLSLALGTATEVQLVAIILLIDETDLLSLCEESLLHV